MSYSWTLSSSTANDTSNLTEYLDYHTESKLVLTPLTELLEADAEYVFGVDVTNAFGYTSSDQTAPIEVVDMELPTVTIKGPSHLEIWSLYQPQMCQGGG